MSYAQGVVTVGTAATLICTPGLQGALVQNLGGTAVFLGGPSVTAGTAVSLPASMTSPVLVPSGSAAGTVGGDSGLYGRMTTGTTTVAFLGVV
jgi:hypothetical protein